MRVVVTGGRSFADLAIVYHVLDMLGVTELGHGGARGADSLAASWAMVRDVPSIVYRPDWSHGPSAGPIRNAKMLRGFAPDLVVSFPGGRGTASTQGIARQLRIPVLDVREGNGYSDDEGNPVYYTWQRVIKDSQQTRAFFLSHDEATLPIGVADESKSVAYFALLTPASHVLHIPDIRTSHYRNHARRFNATP